MLTSVGVSFAFFIAVVSVSTGKNFTLPHISSENGWLLAGGINSANVCAAIATLAPDGVDVRSGICGPDGLKKDSNKIATFYE